MSSKRKFGQAKISSEITQPTPSQYRGVIGLFWQNDCFQHPHSPKAKEHYPDTLKNDDERNALENLSSKVP